MPGASLINIFATSELTTWSQPELEPEDGDQEGSGRQSVECGARSDGDSTHHIKPQSQLDSEPPGGGTGAQIMKCLASF